MPKVIAVFADGTGNSSAKLFRTNVWRLYQALDTSDQIAGDAVRQVSLSKEVARRERVQRQLTCRYDYD